MCEGGGGEGPPEVVVVEAVLLIPEPLPAPELVHGVHDGHKVLKELAGHVLVDGVVLCQDKGHVQHHHAEEGHPGRTVRLLQDAPRREGLGAVKNPWGVKGRGTISGGWRRKKCYRRLETFFVTIFSYPSSTMKI